MILCAFTFDMRVTFDIVCSIKVKTKEFDSLLLLPSFALINLYKCNVRYKTKFLVVPVNLIICGF